MPVSCRGCFGDGGGCPSVGVGNVSAAGIINVIRAVIKGSAPDNHFATGPDCGLEDACMGCIGDVGRNPRIGVRIVSSTGVKIHSNTIIKFPSPDDHFAASPDCSVAVSSRGRIIGAGGCPTVRVWIVSSAVVEIVCGGYSSPNDHFTAGPHRGVTVALQRRAGSTRSCPGIGVWIVSPTGVQGVAAIVSAPDDHFGAGPDCYVI